MSKLKPYYQKDNVTLYHGDCLKIMPLLEEKSIDMIFADPPYFLSGDGITCQSGKMVSVKKADWDEKIDTKSKHEFNRKWIRECKRLLKDTGTIWISGTMHNIYSIGMALEEEGFKIINNITWQKTNPAPNISCRAFTHSTETILWAKKDIKGTKYKFNYKEMKLENSGKQMKDVWVFPTTSPKEKSFGKHPTQKPLILLERIIKSSTECNDVILDPFNGSGTTATASKKLNRNYLGIEKEINYLILSKLRTNNIQTEGFK